MSDFRIDTVCGFMQADVFFTPLELHLMKVRVVNRSAKTMVLINEPWAEQFRIEPGDFVDLIGSGGAGEGDIEMEYIEAGVIFWGWAGSTVSVYRDCELLEQSPQI